MALYIGDTLISGEIEGQKLNLPFTLFQYQWSSFILNNASWLRADTFSWQSGAVYVSAYEQLLTEYNAGTSETAEGITYRLTSTGKKIALPDQETAIASLYASTGKAWYYILDTENERFKLPRELPFDGQAKGNGMTLGLEGKYQGGTGYFGLNASGSGSTGLTASTGLYGKALGTSPTGPDWTPNSGAGVTTDPTKSGIILNRDNTDSQKYLYFYVGETIQDANIIAAASVLTDVADLKNASNFSSLGKETIVGWGMPDYNASIGISALTTFTCPCDGYLAIYTNSESSGQYKSSKITDYPSARPFAYGCLNPAGSACALFYPVEKGEVLTRTFWSGVLSSEFYPLKGVN